MAAAPERIHNVQAVRAFAAIAVVVFHLLPHYIAMGGTFPPVLEAAPWGYAGVDVFFVTSGFVMWHSTRHRPTGPGAAGDFLRRRFLRVYIGYLPFLLLRYFTLDHYNPASLETTSIWKSVFLTSVDHRDLILGISWSLTYELYFYLLFGLTMLLPRRFMLPLWGGVGALVAVLFSLGVDNDLVGWPRTWLSPFVLEFVAGVLLAASMKWWAGRLLTAPIAAAGIGVGIWLGVTTEGNPNRVRIVTFGLAAVGIIALAVWIERRWPTRGTGPIGRMVSSAGDGSYALYLVHLTVILLFFFWGWRTWFAELGRYGPELAILLLTVGSTLFSMAWFKWIEGPAYRAALRRTKPNS